MTGTGSFGREVWVAGTLHQGWETEDCRAADSKHVGPQDEGMSPPLCLSHNDGTESLFSMVSLPEVSVSHDQPCSGSQ